MNNKLIHELMETKELMNDFVSLTTNAKKREPVTHALIPDNSDRATLSLQDSLTDASNVKSNELLTQDPILENSVISKTVTSSLQEALPETSHSQLSYPLPNVRLDGVKQHIFEKFLVQQSFSINVLRSLQQANFSQQLLGHISQCALSDQGLMESARTISQMLPENEFKNNRKVLAIFIKPYVLNNFDFILSWTGAENKSNSLESSFNMFTDRLRMCGYQESFFANSENKNIGVLYDTISVGGRKRITQFVARINEQNEFSLENAIYFMFDREVKEKISIAADKRNNDSFSRLYRKRIADIVDNCLRRLKRAIYSNSTIDADEKSCDATLDETEPDLEAADDFEESDDDTDADADEGSKSNNESDKENDKDDATDANSNPGPGMDIHLNEDEQFSYDDGVSGGHLEFTINMKSITHEVNESRPEDDVVEVKYTSPTQHLLLHKCSHPMRLLYTDSILMKRNINPNHITCIVGHMDLYAEVALLIHCHGFEKMRTITFLEPTQHIDGGFIDLMKTLLGTKWNHYHVERITYGTEFTDHTTGMKRKDERKIVTFFSNTTDEYESNYTQWDIWIQSTQRKQRYRSFDIRTSASHPLPSKARSKLIIEILKLQPGEVCLEIGCGVPYLSLDMALISKSIVMMLDVAEVFNQLKPLFEIVNESFQRTNKKRSKQETDMESAKRKVPKIIYNDDEDEQGEAINRSLSCSSIITVILDIPSCSIKSLALQPDDNLAIIYNLFDKRLLANHKLVFTNTTGKKCDLPKDRNICIKNTKLETECTIKLEMLLLGGMQYHNDKQHKLSVNNDRFTFVHNHKTMHRQFPFMHEHKHQKPNDNDDSGNKKNHAKLVFSSTACTNAIDSSDDDESKNDNDDKDDKNHEDVCSIKPSSTNYRFTFLRNHRTMLPFPFMHKQKHQKTICHTTHESIFESNVPTVDNYHADGNKGDNNRDEIINYHADDNRGDDNLDEIINYHADDNRGDDNPDKIINYHADDNRGDNNRDEIINYHADDNRGDDNPDEIINYHADDNRGDDNPDEIINYYADDNRGDDNRDEIINYHADDNRGDDNPVEIINYHADDNRDDDNPVEIINYHADDDRGDDNRANVGIEEHQSAHNVPIWISHAGTWKSLMYMYAARTTWTIYDLRTEIHKKYRKRILYGDIGRIANTVARINNCVQHNRALCIATGIHITFYNFVKIFITFDAAFQINIQQCEFYLPKHMSTDILYEFVRTQLKNDNSNPNATILPYFMIVNSDMKLNICSPDRCQQTCIASNGSVKHLVQDKYIWDDCNLLVISFPMADVNNSTNKLTMIKIEQSELDFQCRFSINSTTTIKEIKQKILNSEHKMPIKFDPTFCFIEFCYGNQYLFDDVVIETLYVSTLEILFFMRIQLQCNLKFNNDVCLNNHIPIRLDLSTDDIYYALHSMLDSSELEYIVVCGMSQLQSRVQLLHCHDLWTENGVVKLLPVKTIDIELNGIHTNATIGPGLQMKEIIPHIHLLAESNKLSGNFSVKLNAYWPQFLTPNEFEDHVEEVIVQPQKNINEPVFCTVPNPSERLQFNKLERTADDIINSNATVNRSYRMTYPQLLFSDVGNTSRQQTAKKRTIVHTAHQSKQKRLDYNNIGIHSHVNASCKEDDYLIDNEYIEPDESTSRYDQIITTNTYSPTINQELTSIEPDESTSQYDQIITTNTYSPTINQELTSILCVPNQTLSTCTGEEYATLSFLIMRGCMENNNSQVVMKFPLHLPYNETFWYYNTNYNPVESIENNIEMISLSLSTFTKDVEADMTKGFMLIGILTIDSSQKYYVIGIPKKGFINVIKLYIPRCHRYYKTIYYHHQKYKSKYILNSSCVVTVCSVNDSPILINCNKNDWNARMDILTDDTVNRLSYMKKIRGDVKRRQKLRASVPSDLIPPDAIKNITARSTMQSIGYKTSQNKGSAKLIGRINQFHLSKEPNVFAKLINISSLYSTLNDIRTVILSETNSASDDYINEKLGALSVFLFHDIRWRMSNFNPVSNAIIKKLSYDIDSVALDFCCLQIDLTHNIINDTDFLTQMREDIYKFQLNICNIGNSIDLMGEHSRGLGGHTYMNKDNRKGYYTIPHENDFVFKCSINLPLEQNNILIKKAETIVAEFLCPRLSSCDPRLSRLQNGCIRGGNMRIEGGSVFALLVVSLLLKWNTDGINVVFETYGNKNYHTIEKNNVSHCSDVGQKLFDGQNQSVVGLLFRIAEFYTNPPNDRPYNFFIESAKMYTGIGCVVYTIDQEGNKLFTGIDTITPPGDCTSLNPCDFYYETKTTLKGSSEKLHECWPLKFKNLWTFYPIYNFLLPFEMMPVTITGKYIKDVVSANNMQSDIFRIQKYYPPSRYEAIDMKRFDSKASILESNVDGYYLDIERFQVQFHEFYNDVTEHMTWMINNGVPARIEVASCIDLTAQSINTTSIQTALQNLVDDIFAMIQNKYKGYNIKEIVEYQKLYLMGLKAKLHGYGEVLSNSDDIERFQDALPGCFEIEQLMKSFCNGKNITNNRLVPHGRLSLCIGRPLLVPINKHVERVLIKFLQCKTSNNLRDILFQRLELGMPMEWRQFSYFTKRLQYKVVEPLCCNTCFKIFRKNHTEAFAHHACIAQSQKLQPLSQTGFKLNLLNMNAIIDRDPSQKKLRDIVLHERANVFLTGRAGSGKTFTLSFLSNILQYHYGETAVAIMASTRLVAERLGGDTIHSFFGLPYNFDLDNTNHDVWLQHIKYKFHNNDEQAMEMFGQIQFIIIDEVSLISSYALDTINNVFQVLSGQSTNATQPFGGKTIILAGDVLQLPPLSEKRFSNNLPPFFFFAKVFWQSKTFEVVYLQGNHRCKDMNNSNNTSNHIQILNDVREAQSSVDLTTINNRWGQGVCVKSILEALIVTYLVSRDELDINACEKIKRSKHGNELLKAKRDYYNHIRSKYKHYLHSRSFTLCNDEGFKAESRIIIQRFQTINECMHDHLSQLKHCCDCTIHGVSMLNVIDMIKTCKLLRTKCHQPTLILVALNREVEQANKLLEELATQKIYAEDCIYINDQHCLVEDEDIYQALKKKYEKNNNALPFCIVHDKGTMAIGAQNRKELGIIKNALGTIHGLDETKDMLLFSPHVGKSDVWSTHTWERIPLIAQTLNLPRITHTYDCEWNGRKYQFLRKQFPIKSVIAINSHVIQGQELTIPTVVSLARNSQSISCGINYGNLYTQISRFTTSENCFLVHSMVMDDIKAHPLCQQVDEYHRNKIHSFVDYSFDDMRNLKPNITPIVRYIGDKDIHEYTSDFE